jgi:hypothetical protein
MGVRRPAIGYLIYLQRLEYSCFRVGGGGMLARADEQQHPAKGECFEHGLWS